MSTTTDKKLKVYEGQKPLILIEASKLKVDDDFIKEVDAFDKIKDFRNVLINCIKSTSNIHDFYVQSCDPSEKEDGSGIEYVEGRMPAVNHSFYWGRKAAYEYAPHLGSRSGTYEEYILFCGVLIKALIENGYSVDDAWKEVSVDSKGIGNYKNNGKSIKRVLLPTGSVKVAGFADLANTCKELTGKSAKFYWASGAYCHRSDFGFVANVERMYCPNNDEKLSVPWVVIPT